MLLETPTCIYAEAYFWEKLYYVRVNGSQVIVDGHHGIYNRFGSYTPNRRKGDSGFPECYLGSNLSWRPLMVN